MLKNKICIKCAMASCMHPRKMKVIAWEYGKCGKCRQQLRKVTLQRNLTGEKVNYLKDQRHDRKG